MAGMPGEVWFSLFQTNEESKAIVNDVRNRGHVEIADGAGAAPSKAIQVVFRDNLKPHRILSFGRSPDSDIASDPPGTAIGRRMGQRQCSFYFHNRSLIFRDHSEQQTTSISPSYLDSPGRWYMDQIPRQRAIPECGDWNISMGPATFLLRFRQNERWWERDFAERDALAKRIVPNAFALTDPPPWRERPETRVQIPNVPEKKWHAPIVYHELERLGNARMVSFF